jgi:hypothetical protein
MTANFQHLEFVLIREPAHPSLSPSNKILAFKIENTRLTSFTPPPLFMKMLVGKGGVYVYKRTHEA